MESFIDKISTYNIFNYLFPGIIFTVFVSKLTPYNIHLDSILESLVVGYFIGLVISRVGSLTIEPILKKLKVIKKSEYSAYITASKKDPLIATLSEVLNMYRTLASMLFCLLIVLIYSIIKNECSFKNNFEIIIAIFLLFSLFILAAKKQGAYLNERIIIANKL